MDRLGLPRGNILAYTLPGFATSAGTRDNAWKLMQALGTSAAEIDIRPSCTQMLKDLGHPFADGQPVYDVTFENVQAGERTSHLFRLANLHNALVLGTGDLSEIALGWSTYGVGDQMSHYNVNASVPKTLIQYLIRWVIASASSTRRQRRAAGHPRHRDLAGAGAGGRRGRGRPAEHRGPHRPLRAAGLQHLLHHPLRPQAEQGRLPRLARLARPRPGEWPDNLPPSAATNTTSPRIRRWLEVFLWRFFKTSQFKRSCMPNGPKVGSGGSLSPRGDWRAPSDSEAEVWLDAARVKPTKHS
jgi:NAD+ synthase (glutamine-hydrolysing)